ncbi:neurogenic locus Notch protein isoform X2 [Drosophila grimshawi]|uniref:neurogenic locus Notch protein isoform X2 n=1 Tax=Drosophila grimshawi TaxID=7222 RepID=UPI001C935D55|nr:neurogenic locus Notch protein isoform X2 [Drosophila grimshawi]
MSATRTLTTITTRRAANWRWLCCFLCLAAVAQASNGSGSGIGGGSHSSPKSMARPTAAIPKDTTHINKYKRQDKYQQQQQQQQQLQLHQKQQQQLQLRSDAVAARLTGAKQQKPLTRGAHGLNKKLLNKMGFMKVKAPNSHNRKRLAVESRRHASRDDSHMFIIKLPPNLHYYTAPSSSSSGSSGGSSSSRNALDVVAAPKVMPHPMANSVQHDNAQKISNAPGAEAVAATEASALKTNGKKVSFPFSSNGRPGRIYHWNLPVLKQALHKKPHFAHVSQEDRNRLLDIENIPTWRKPWENDTIEKSFTTGTGKSKYRKSLKQKSPTYYAPAQAVNKQSFHKYFAGNGKPKGFYVIKEHQTKPQFYQNIIS